MDHGTVGSVEIRSLTQAESFTTKDGSTIRELLGLPTSSARNQSLAEATLPPGGATERHYHLESEEIYYLVEGTGEMELDDERCPVAPGDAVLIPPGAWHQIRAAAGGPLRFLCCCAPPYRHEDTFFA
jgi:mannose-6-phosphate isomerase-like protein (cupin superfamily)